MSIVNAQLAGWAASWFPKELVGALTGRQAAYIHRRVRAALSTAEHFGAVAQDLSKAFDTIDPMVAAAIMRRIGLPDGIINCWLEFYRKCSKIFRNGKSHSEARHQVRGGIIQGCPLSPFVLNLHMLLWSLVVTNTTKAEVGAFVDDGFAWSTADPANISSDMREVDAITRRFDATFGFQPNHSKYQVVGSTDEAKEAMQGIIEDVDVGEHMELLGLEYDTTKSNSATINDKRWKKFQARARRIRVFQRRSTRRRLLRTTAMPVISWAGPFCQTFQSISSLKAITAATVYGSVPVSLSKFLVREAVLENADDLAWLVDVAKVKELLNWAKERTYPNLWTTDVPPTKWVPGLQKLLDSAGWEFDESNFVIKRVDHFGCTRYLSLLWDSTKLVEEWVAQYHRAKAWRAEARIWKDSKPCVIIGGTVASGLQLPPPPKDNRESWILAHANAAMSKVLCATTWQVALGGGPTSGHLAKKNDCL